MIIGKTVSQLDQVQYSYKLCLDKTGEAEPCPSRRMWEITFTLIERYRTPRNSILSSITKRWNYKKTNLPNMKNRIWVIYLSHILWNYFCWNHASIDIFYNLTCMYTTYITAMKHEHIWHKSPVILELKSHISPHAWLYWNEKGISLKKWLGSNRIRGRKVRAKQPDRQVILYLVKQVSTLSAN